MMHRTDTVRLNRRSLALGLLLLARPAAARSPCAPATVLFVCPAGTVKSAIAREVLRRRAAIAGVPVQVQSRGLQIEDHVSPLLETNLRADGIDLRSEPAKRLAGEDLSRADIVVAFDDAARAPGMSQARTWLVPSWNSQYAEAKTALAPQVAALIQELAGRPCRR